MNPNHIMLKSIRKLEKLILYKNIKIFGYAINDVENCKNYKLYFYVNSLLCLQYFFKLKKNMFFFNYMLL